MVDLVIAVVSYNTKKLTLKCLESIFHQKASFKFEVWVADNGSKDNTLLEVKKRFPQAKIIANKDNLGFVHANNQILSQARGRMYLLLNSDTELKGQTLEKLVKFALDNYYGIVSCKLINKDGSLQPNFGGLPTPLAVFLWLSGLDDLGRKFGIILPSFHDMNPKSYQGDKEVGWVAGTALLVKSEVIKQIGKLDPRFFMYVEDVDFCWRARRYGFKVGWTDKAVIKHLGGGSSSNPHFAQWLGEFRGLIYLYQKYYGKWMAKILQILIYLFATLRMILFYLLGRKEVAKIYAKVLGSL